MYFCCNTFWINSDHVQLEVGGRKNEDWWWLFFLSADAYQSVKYAVRHLSHSWCTCLMTGLWLNLARPPCCPLKSCYCVVSGGCWDPRKAGTPSSTVSQVGVALLCLYPHPHPSSSLYECAEVDMTMHLWRGREAPRQGWGFIGLRTQASPRVADEAGIFSPDSSIHHSNSPKLEHREAAKPLNYLYTSFTHLNLK